ncbi:MAG: hypothetical protein ACAF41_08160 [Leptolyngbya sp. BL-A-14]
MVWNVQVLEITDEHGHGIGKYRRVANSSDEGGMHPLCDHQHDSIDEAEHCPDALAKTVEITGVPDGSHADRAAQLEVEAEQLLAEAAQLKEQDKA